MSKTSSKKLKKEAKARKTKVFEKWLGLCCEVDKAALDERKSA